jgi:hypothetical protein
MVVVDGVVFSVSVMESRLNNEEETKYGDDSGGEQ